MNSKEQIDWIRLLRSEGIGQITFHKLISKFISPTKALEFISERKNIRIAPDSVATRELDEANDIGAKVLFSNDENYPKLLKQIPDLPAVLYVLGNIDALNNRTVALVGSRNASINSKVLTENMAGDLVDCGYTVVSGMAVGIDTSAHSGALHSSNLDGKKTVAVLAGGVNNIYPTSNTRLYYRIIEEGAVISEMPVGTSPQANLFPRRNRIISGLSYGTAIMEASIKSGSLITARFATEQNREVFAVPNFPRDPRAGGTNMLIKNGATLVENTTDITSVLDNITADSIIRNDLFSGIREDSVSYLPEDDIDFENLDLQGKILSLLSSYSVSIDSLVRELPEYSEAQISNALLNLELDDKISYPSTGKIILKL